jgi:hypothetical protein
MLLPKHYEGKIASYSVFTSQIQADEPSSQHSASDVWDSAAFSNIFLASSFSCSQTESTSVHTQVTQTVETVE